MSVRLIVLTPTIEGAPGETAVGRIQIHNDGTVDSTYTVDIVGLEASGLDETTPSSLTEIVVPADSTATCEVPIRVPITLGIGQHAAAFEVIGDRPGDRAALVPFTLAIASVARVELTSNPATIRARRRADFHLDIANHEAQPVDIVLDGEAPDVRVRFIPDRFRLAPGQRAVAKGTIKGPRRLTGEVTQHNILVSARGRAATTSVNTAYVQRPLFAHRLRGLLVAVTVIALWLGAIGGVALWWSGRDSGPTANAAAITGVDTNGDGIPDSFLDADGNPVTGVDTDGDGIPDSFFDADGNPITGTDTNGDGIPDTLVGKDGKPLKAVDTDGDGIPDALSDGSAAPGKGATGGSEQVADAGPSSTVVRGTVKADGDPSNVSITLAPIELGAQPDPQATPMGFAGGGNSRATTGRSAKIWSARFGRVDSFNATRQSQAIAPIVKSPASDGVWLFTDVALRQTYEIVFAKPGFDTQSFVVTPPDDGSPVDLDVDLKPARGSVSGVVTGPSGPLGGVAITVTDGTLSFETTSATAGKIGSWSLEGVSTPSVYSVTGTLRGYGTEVRQVELQAGDQRNDVNLAMKRGVGAISGRIADVNGQPLGGVTVTATNGDESRTTSTLTGGDIGSYNLPQLTVPATWTITVERPGYLTQTRRLPLGGSIPNVDFGMIKESLQLTGRITSSNGGGIVNAGLTLTTGDLTFKVSTAAAPDAGAFSIDNLPPGNYTVTAEHFKHETATEFVTLVAGVSPLPLNMTLKATTGIPPVGNGSLVVSVLDSDPLAVPQGIDGATVTLVLTRTGEIVRTINDASSSNVRIDTIPLGTYTLLVSADSYNSSVAQQVSIGLQEERREVRLQQLGQAGGKVIDSITKVTLTGYAVTIVQERTGGDFRIGRYVEKGGVWQTEPTDLGNGTYRLEFQPGDEPVGYKVRPNQKLDSSLPDGTLMRFVVRDGKTRTQVVINDIAADPYPVITGRVSKPVLGTPTTFTPIDSQDLSVAATCNGAVVGVELLDTAGLSNVDNTLYDEFSIDELAIAAVVPSASLPTTCTVTMTAPGTDDVSYTLNNVDAANAGTRGDRRVSAALVVSPEAQLSGTAFWYDGPVHDLGHRIALDNVNISATGFITGFTPVEGPPPAGTPDPGVTTGSATTTSAAGGSWTIDAPLFGTTDYSFERDGFQNGTMPITVDGAAPTVGPGTGTGVIAVKEGASFAVEMRPPNAGVLNGKISIVTSNTVVAYDEVTITATDPFGNVTVSAPGTRDFPAPDASGRFTIDPAAAGTWSVTFTPPANHAFFGSGGATVAQRIDPGATRSGFDTTMVELATVTTRLHDKTDPGSTIVGVDAAISLTGTSARTRPLGDIPSDGAFVVDRLQVAASTPNVTSAPYQMAVDVPGYAVRTATVEVNNQPAGAAGTSNIAFGALAGQNVTVDIFLQPIGVRIGSVLGDTGAGLPVEKLSLAAGGGTGKTIVTATRVRDRDGTPLQVGDVELTDPPPVVTAGPGDGEFSLAGSAGYYRLAVSHYEYEAPDAAGTPSDTIADGGTLGIFRIADGDTTPIGQYTLGIIEGTVDVRAVESLAPPLVDVEGATYHAFRNPGTCTATPPPGALTDEIPAGGIDLALVPGAYCLQITKTTAGVSVAFPAITTITITRATTGAPGSPSVPSSTSVIAPLPALASSVTGKIVAENENGGSVELPGAPTVITVSSTFDEPNEILKDGSTAEPNENPDSGDRTAVAKPTVPADYSFTYTLENVAGTNTITAPDLSSLGYENNNRTRDVTIMAPGPFTAVAPFVYTVANADVRIKLLPQTDTFEPTDAKLISPTLAEYDIHQPFDPVTNTLTFTSVPPEAGTWTLTFTDALHAAVSASFTIGLELDGNNCDTLPASCYRVAKPDVTTTGTLARLTGSVQQRATQTGPLAPLADDAKMVLTSKTTPFTIYTLTGPQDPYIFDVPAGKYSLTITSPGYIDNKIDEIDLTGAAGTVTPLNYTIDKAVNISVVYDNVTPPNLPSTLKVQLLPGPIAPKVGSTTEFPPLSAGAYQVQVVDTATTNPYPTYTGASVTYGIGVSPTVHVLLPRLVAVNVAGVASGVDTTVTVTGLNSYSRTVTAERSQFTFSSLDTSTPLPVNGALTVKISAPGYRTQTFSAGEVLYSNQSLTLHKNVVLSGTIDAPAGMFTVTSGTHTATATIDDDNKYSVTLGVGSSGENLTWTIPAYDKLGVGTAPSFTVDVTTTSADTVTRNITVTPQPMKVDFAVTEAGSASADAAITLGSASDTTVGGAASFSATEDAVPINWTVKKPGFIWAQGTVSTAMRYVNTLATTINISVPLEARAATVITGTFKNNGTAIDDAEVKTCEITPSLPNPLSNCIATQTPGVTDTGGNFSITTSSPGSYRIWVVKNNGTKASVDYTIDGFMNVLSPSGPFVLTP